MLACLLINVQHLLKSDKDRSNVTHLILWFFSMNTEAMTFPFIGDFMFL